MRSRSVSSREYETDDPWYMAVLELALLAVVAAIMLMYVASKEDTDAKDQKSAQVEVRGPVRD